MIKFRILLKNIVLFELDFFVPFGSIKNRYYELLNSLDNLITEIDGVYKVFPGNLYNLVSEISQ